jgi:hypothetical protein
LWYTHWQWIPTPMFYQTTIACYTVNICVDHRFDETACTLDDNMSKFDVKREFYRCNLHMANVALLQRVLKSRGPVCRGTNK